MVPSPTYDGITSSKPERSACSSIVVQEEEITKTTYQKTSLCSCFEKRKAGHEGELLFVLQHHTFLIRKGSEEQNEHPRLDKGLLSRS